MMTRTVFTGRLPLASLCGLVAATFLSMPLAWAVDLGDLRIPASRVPDWSHVGVDGGIPDTSVAARWPVIDATDAPYNADPSCNGGNDYAAIHGAVSAAGDAYGDGRDGTVVFLPAGCYDWNDEILYIPSHVVLKGAGIGQTIVEMFHGGPSTYWQQDCGSQANMFMHGTRSTNDQGLSDGYTRGSTTLTYSSAPGYVAGDYLEIYEDQDAALFDHPHTCGAYLRQVVRVLAANGTTITLDRALRHGFSAGQSPRTRKISPVMNAGIESLTLKKDPSISNAYRRVLTISYAVNCWAKSVHFYWGSNGLVALGTSRDVTIAGSKFEKDELTAPVAEGGQGSKNNSAALHVDQGATDSLVVNNVFADVEVSVKFETAPTGNVYAYNYSYNLLNEYRDSFPHGSYPSETLLEGNTAAGRMGFDDHWGRQGPRNVWFRNRALGNARGLTTHNMTSSPLADSAAFIGNVATNVFQYPFCDSPPDCHSFDEETSNLWAEKNRYTNLFVNYSQESTTTYVNESSVCAYTDHAGQSQDCAGFVGPYVKTRAANGDSHATGYSGTTVPDAWSGFDLPASLYLTSRPAFWCTELPWPAVGADVDDTNNLYEIPAQRREEGLPCTLSGSGTCRDDDGDGYGDPATSCNQTEVDCDDRDAAVHPGATETCNDVDDDCNGTVDDEGCAQDPETVDVIVTPPAYSCRESYGGSAAWMVSAVWMLRRRQARRGSA